MESEEIAVARAQHYNCVMLPAFTEEGLLPPVFHWVGWDEFVRRFGHNPWRMMLLEGLRVALENLKNSGCHVAYIDGSFVTEKLYPGDFDVCWDEDGVDPTTLDPILFRFEVGMVAQKEKYLGELYPARSIADSDGRTFLEFFQIESDTETPKGIVAIDLEEL